MISSIVRAAVLRCSSTPSNTHPPFFLSFHGAPGRSSTCQVVYLSFGVCGLHGIPVREGKPVVAALPWLSTNIGSRHATLAAKKAWMQWSTAKRLENSSSWGTDTGRDEQSLEGAGVMEPLGCSESEISARTSKRPPSKLVIVLFKTGPGARLPWVASAGLRCGWAQAVEPFTWKYRHGSGH